MSTISNSPDAANKISSTTAFYLKGFASRSEVNSGLFSSVTIYDFKTGTGVILRLVNGQKLLIRMNEENWKQKNKIMASTPTPKTTGIAPMPAPPPTTIIGACR